MLDRIAAWGELKQVAAGATIGLLIGRSAKWALGQFWWVGIVVVVILLLLWGAKVYIDLVRQIDERSE